jgi:hypothetical protein
MTSGRTPADGNAIRIDVVRLGVSPQVSDGAFAVFNLRRERSLSRQAVLDRGTDKSTADNWEDLPDAAVFRTSLPATTMDPDIHGTRRLRRVLG